MEWLLPGIALDVWLIMRSFLPHSVAVMTARYTTGKRKLLKSMRFTNIFRQVDVQN